MLVSVAVSGRGGWLIIGGSAILDDGELSLVCGILSKSDGLDIFFGRYLKHEISAPSTSASTPGRFTSLTWHPELALHLTLTTESWYISSVVLLTSAQNILQKA